LAHVLEENKNVHDRQLAQASSVEQASNTKDRFQRPEERKEKSEQMHFVPSERAINEFHMDAPVIKSSQFEVVSPHFVPLIKSSIFRPPPIWMPQFQWSLPKWKKMMN
jgi:hypothetical protein